MHLDTCNKYRCHHKQSALAQTQRSTNRKPCLALRTTRSWDGQASTRLLIRVTWSAKILSPRAGWEERDVDIQITHRGVCASDLHLLRSGCVSLVIKTSGRLFRRMLNKSAEAIPYPCCVVHEIGDRAVRVGSRVEGGIKSGDRVDVGAPGYSCLGCVQSHCNEFASGNEHFCAQHVGIYGSFQLDSDESYRLAHCIIALHPTLSSRPQMPLLLLRQQ